MDPDCAICHAPAQAACDCEAKCLDVAIKQAEDRMMRSIYAEIRSWVRGHAQDFVLEYFRLLADQRKDAHSGHMDRIHSQAWYHYRAPPHPQQIVDAQADLKRGIDEDWQKSVQRYPEVLEYFFNLVELSLPSDEDPAVRDPPLTSTPSNTRKSGRRALGNMPAQSEGLPPALVPPSYTGMINGIPPRTAPLPERHEGRPSREKRALRHSMPPQGAPYAPYHAPYM